MDSADMEPVVGVAHYLREDLSGIIVRAVRLKLG